MDQITVNFSLKRDNDNMIKPNNTLDLNDIKKGKKKKSMVKPQLKKNKLTVDFKK